MSFHYFYLESYIIIRVKRTIQEKNKIKINCLYRWERLNLCRRSNKITLNIYSHSYCFRYLNLANLKILFRKSITESFALQMAWLPTVSF